jgi:hypothetical protein
VKGFDLRLAYLKRSKLKRFGASLVLVVNQEEY